MITDSLNLENPKIAGSRWSHPPDNPIGVPRKLWANHFTVLFCVPNPKRLKSKLKLVLEGLMPCRTPNVIAQHSQVDKILVQYTTGHRSRIGNRESSSSLRYLPRPRVESPV